MLFSLTKPLRSHTKRPRSLQTFCAPLRNFTYTVHCIPPRNFVFTCKTFVFAQETFAFTYKTFALPEKLSTFCTPPRNFVFDHKLLCSLEKTLHQLCKTFMRNFAFANKSFALPEKVSVCSYNFCICTKKQKQNKKHSLAKKVSWVNANVSVESYIKTLW